MKENRVNKMEGSHCVPQTNQQAGSEGDSAESSLKVVRAKDCGLEKGE